MFEHHSQPLLSRREFFLRSLRYTSGALLLIAASWLIGIIGYHVLEGLPWIDSLLNAAMILGGMGPVDRLVTTGGKLFASFYALFSGIIFLVSLGVMLAPVIHRFMHKFHIQNKEN